MQMKVDTEKLRLKADTLEHINQQYGKDKKDMTNLVTKSVIKSEQLALKCEEILRNGNNQLRKETEEKMC